MQVAMVEQRLHQQRDAANFEHVLGDITAARLQIRDIRCSFEDLGHVKEVELDPAFICNCWQMQRGIGRAAGRRHNCGSVFQSFLGDDVARPDVQLDQLDDHLAGGHAEGIADFVRRGSAGRIRQRKADRLGDRRHGVGGELGAAGAGRRTRHVFHLVEIFVREAADRVAADRLEHVLHGDGLAAEIAGQDRAAVDEDRRHVEPHHRHHHAGKRLVAAGEPDEGVIAVAAHGELDRVRDHFARRQRRIHAGMAHGDAVGDGDGAELARRAAVGRNALLHRLRLAHQGDVAGRGFVPA